MERSKQGGQFARGFVAGNALELGLELGKTGLVDGGSVHTAGVLVADLLFVGRAGSRDGRRLFENLAKMLAIELGKLGEAAVRGLVGGEGIAGKPTIATVAVEILAGIDGVVDQCGVKNTQLRAALGP